RGGSGSVDTEHALNRREVEALDRTKPPDVPDPPDILDRVSTMAARGLLRPDQSPRFPEAERGRTHARRLRRPMDVQVDVGHDSTLVLESGAHITRFAVPVESDLSIMRLVHHEALCPSS